MSVDSRATAGSYIGTLLFPELIWLALMYIGQHLEL